MIKAQELTHAELEHYHYESLKDPLYAMQGLMEIRLEELSVPVTQPAIQETKTSWQSQWTRKQWYTIKQLRGEVAFLHKKIAELESKKPRDRGKI